MLDLSKKGCTLPSAIEVDGILFPIHTDFKYWISFYKLSTGKTVSADTFDYLFINPKKTPEDKQKMFQALLEFFQPPKEIPRRLGESSSEVIFSYDYDSDFVFAAFMQVYHIDLMEAEMHWHKYLALFDSLRGTMLNDIMGFRAYDPNDKTTYEQSKKQLKQIWEIPQILTEQEQEALDEFNSKFK